MNLRLRINLLITTLMLLFMLATGSIIIDNARKSIREEIETATKVTVQLLTTVIYNSQFIPHTPSQRQVVLDFLINLGRVRANEIQLYNAPGDLMYSSPPSTYKPGRSAPDWFARLVAPKREVVKLNIRNATLVITPEASRAILDAWDDMQDLLWLALSFFILINALVFWVIGRSLRPVETILGGLSQMQQGKLHARLPQFSLPEFASISDTFNRMAGALQDSMAENRRLALIVKQSSDAIMIRDLNDSISFWNPAAERLFGYPWNEIAGRSAAMLAPPGREAELAQHLAIVARRGMVENVESQLLNRDGRLIEVALSAAPLVDPYNEQVIGEICSMRDITEKKRAQQATLELEQNRQLTRVIQGHLEEERRSLARELHDELGQCVTAIKSIGVSIANRSRGQAPEIHTSAQTIVTVAGRIYDAVHGIIRRLRPSELDNLGLSETLRDAVATWRRRHPEVGFELRLAGNVDGLAETVNITVYRIVQECLTNVIRHAAASRVEIALARTVPQSASEPGQSDTDVLHLTVQDNGTGMAPNGGPAADQFGLLGMRERVQALNGRFAAGNAADGGFGVRVTIPVSVEHRPSALAPV